jgi:hypothetical protein
MEKNQELFELTQNKTLKEYLQKLPTSPFQSGKITKTNKIDTEYLTIVEQKYCIMSRIYKIKKKIDEGSMETPIETTKFTIHQNEKILKILQENIKTRLKNEKNEEGYEPRVLRLAKKFDLNEKETEALVFILISQTGIEYNVLDYYSNSATVFFIFYKDGFVC